MTPEFISEPIEPAGPPIDPGASSRSEPLLPAAFRWRGREYRISEILKSRKGIERDRTHGSSERYLRKHWFRFRTDTGEVLTVYFDRQSANPRRPTERWWLYTIERA